MKSPEKRKKILQAAEEVFSEHGLGQATIAEIGKRAGVRDSFIYQFFKGKEDLLFSIPGERIKEVLELLRHQLEGISHTESRLRKLAWFHLWYNDQHPEYTRILLLECQSSMAFYSTPAYKLVREYAKIVSEILQEGVDNGSFKSDLDILLMRDVVLGTLNEQTIRCAALQEVQESVSNLEDIMSLFSAMLSGTKEKTLNRSEAILVSAEAVFAEKGFAKATISEIASRVQVAEGTLYEYFKNKQDLLFSIPTKRFEQYLSELSIAFEITDPVRKLRRFIKYHFSLFLSKRDFLKVFLLEIHRNKRFYESEAYKSYRSYYTVLENIIEEGKKEGCFRSDVNASVFRNMFLGTFNQVSLRWVIYSKFNNIAKIEEIDKLTDLLCSAVLCD